MERISSFETFVLGGMGRIPLNSNCYISLVILSHDMGNVKGVGVKNACRGLGGQTFFR